MQPINLDKNQFFGKFNQELAKEFNLSPKHINLIRSWYFSQKLSKEEIFKRFISYSNFYLRAVMFFQKELTDDKWLIFVSKTKYDK